MLLLCHLVEDYMEFQHMAVTVSGFQNFNIFLDFWKFNKLEGVRGSKKVEKKVLGMGFAWWAKCLYTSWEYF